MKESPKEQKLEHMLRSSILVAGGFMGTETRSVADIIAADLATLEQHGVTAEQLAKRMQQITNQAKPGLGTWVTIEANVRAMTDGAKGGLVCPWPHGGRFNKTLTTAERIDSGNSVRWSDLNIHLIAEHGFFEGRGSTFRVEPDKIIEIIMTQTDRSEPVS
jgi:hypothetical protein